MFWCSSSWPVSVAMETGDMLSDGGTAPENFSVWGAGRRGAERRSAGSRAGAGDGLTSVIILPLVLVLSLWAARLCLRVRTRSRVVRYSRENSLMIRQNEVTLMSRTEEDG